MSDAVSTRDIHGLLSVQLFMSSPRLGGATLDHPRCEAAAALFLVGLAGAQTQLAPTFLSLLRDQRQNGRSMATWDAEDLAVFRGVEKKDLSTMDQVLLVLGGRPSQEVSRSAHERLRAFP